MESFVCITGAAGGLGKAFAIECASRGWNLFLTDLTETSLCVLSKSLVSTYGIEVFYFPCDLTDDIFEKKLFGYIKSKNLKFKMLINVAGLDYEGFFTQKTLSQIKTVMRLNMEANLKMTYSIMEMRDCNEVFRIINVASLAAFYPMPVKAMYSASKRFILNFSMALREELKGKNATVTALCPAGMPTTENCRRSIESQGFAGRITTKNVGYVAYKTVNHARKGHAVYIPGFLNRILSIIAKIIPVSFTAHIICLRWKSTRRKKEVTVL